MLDPAFALALSIVAATTPALCAQKADRLLRRADAALASERPEEAAALVRAARARIEHAAGATEKGSQLFAIDVLEGKADPLAATAAAAATSAALKLLRLGAAYERRKWHTAAVELYASARWVRRELSGDLRLEAPACAGPTALFAGASDVYGEKGWEHTEHGTRAPGGTEALLLAPAALAPCRRIRFQLRLDRDKGSAGIAFAHKSQDDYHILHVLCENGRAQASAEIRHWSKEARAWQPLVTIPLVGLADLPDGWIDCVLELRGGDITFRIADEAWVSVAGGRPDLTGRFGWWVPAVARAERRAEFRLVAIEPLEDASLGARLTPAALVESAGALAKGTDREGAAAAMRAAMLDARADASVQKLASRGAAASDTMHGRRIATHKDVAKEIAKLAGAYVEQGWLETARRQLVLAAHFDRETATPALEAVAAKIRERDGAAADALAEHFAQPAGEKGSGFTLQDGVLSSPAPSGEARVVLAAKPLGPGYSLDVELKLPAAEGPGGGLVLGHKSASDFVHIQLGATKEATFAQALYWDGRAWTELLVVRDQSTEQTTEAERAGWIPLRVECYAGRLTLAFGRAQPRATWVEEFDLSGRFGVMLASEAKAGAPLRARKLHMRPAP